MIVGKENSLVDLIRTPEEFQALAFPIREMSERFSRLGSYHDSLIRHHRRVIIFNTSPQWVTACASTRLNSYSWKIKEDESSLPLFGSYKFLKIVPSEEDLKATKRTFATRLWHDLPNRSSSCLGSIECERDQSYDFEGREEILKNAAGILFEDFKKCELENGACIYFSPNVEKMGRSNLADKIIYSIVERVKVKD